MTFEDACKHLIDGKAVRRPDWYPGIVATFHNPWVTAVIYELLCYWTRDGEKCSDVPYVSKEWLTATDWELSE